MMKLILILFFPVALYGQDAFTEQMRDQLSDYYRKEIPLKAHLTLNQTSYFPGDTVYYTARLLLAENLLPVKVNTFMNVLLKDANGHIVVKQMIRINNGFSGNQIIIPENISPANYFIVAYNDWMESFGEDLYFKKWIAIGTHPSPITTPVNNDLHVFAEGGHFIQTLNNRIVISGKPFSHGSVHDDKGDEIQKFSLDESGLGFVYITPEPGRKYFASYDGDVSQAKFPEVEKDGISLLATPYANSRSLKVIIQAPASSPLRQQKLYLMAAAHGGIFFAANFQLSTNPYVSVSIPFDEAPSGIARLMLLTEKEEVLSERLFFVPPYNEPAIVLESDKEKYQTRQKVTVKMKVSDSIKASTISSFSATVFRKQDQIVSDKNIISDLLLYGDLPGTSSASVNLFNDSVSYNKIDNYLVTQRWMHSLTDNRIPDDKPKYLADRIRIKGKVVSTSGEPVPDSSRITFLLQKDVSVYEANVFDSNFSATFLIDFYGEENIIYTVEYKGKKIEDARVIVDERFPFTNSAASENAALTESFATQRKQINEAFTFYNTTIDYNAQPKPHDFFEEEIFGADIEIKLSDYILFPTMEETLREVIPMVQHRRIKDEHVVRVFLDELDRFAEGTPLFIVDGVMTDDQEYFLRLKPSEVSKVKVVYSLDKLNVFGALGKGGIILVETNIPDNAKNVPASESSFKLNGLTRPLPFRMLLQEDERIPDLRTALYWNAHATTDKDGNASFSFFTSDVTGDFTIRVEGLTGEGKPFYEGKTFTVKFEPVVSR